MIICQKWVSEKRKVVNYLLDVTYNFKDEKLAFSPESISMHLEYKRERNEISECFDVPIFSAGNLSTIKCIYLTSTAVEVVIFP